MSDYEERRKKQRLEGRDRINSVAAEVEAGEVLGPPAEVQGLDPVVDPENELDPPEDVQGLEETRHPPFTDESPEDTE